MSTAVRDHYRRRRSMRLMAAYYRTGDRRKLKRAKRLERQVWGSTLRRVSDELIQLGAAYQRAVQGLVKSMSGLGALQISLPCKPHTIVAPPRDPA